MYESAGNPNAILLFVGRYSCFPLSAVATKRLRQAFFEVRNSAFFGTCDIYRGFVDLTVLEVRC